MFYENLQKICDAKGVKVTTLVEKLGFSSGNLSKWKNGSTPKGNTLLTIAEELGVSVNHLLGQDDESFTQQFYPLLTQEQKSLVDNMVREFVGKSKSD